MTIDTEIKYSRPDRDYSCYVDGRYIGSRSTYSQADTLVNQVVADLLADGLAYSAAELDDAQADDDEEQGPCDDINAPPDRARCATCDGEGRIPCDGYGDQAGGWAETCPDCDGKFSLQPV